VVWKVLMRVERRLGRLTHPSCSHVYDARTFIEGAVMLKSQKQSVSGS